MNPEHCGNLLGLTAHIQARASPLSFLWVLQSDRLAPGPAEQPVTAALGRQELVAEWLRTLLGTRLISQSRPCSQSRSAALFSFCISGGCSGEMNVFELQDAAVQAAAGGAEDTAALA